MQVFNDEEGLVVRCYSLEEQYAQMVQNDLIQKAIEENT